MSEKKNILSVLALILAVIALAVAAIGLLPRESTPEQPVENPALEQEIAALEAKVADLTAQVELLSRGTGIAKWNLITTPWENSAGADVTLTAEPAVFEEGMSAVFSVRLEGEEVAHIACEAGDEVFTATASLPGADGYSYYCILIKADGSREQFALSTPENPVEDIPVYLAESLTSYCNMTVDGWLDADGKVTLISGYIQVQLPRISASGAVEVESARLSLNHNGESYAELDIALKPGEGFGAYELQLDDMEFDLPKLEEDDYLDLWVIVKLSNGMELTAPGASWFNGADGLFLVVG